MKRTSLLVTSMLLALASVPAQVVITSFNQNGQLTWTNLVSDGTYRVEWAGSPTGAWQSFDVLTNLSLINATSNVLTVHVPTFYRVVWLDPPEPNGTWQYEAYNKDDVLVVTGRLFMVSQTNSVNGIAGTWNLQSTGNSPESPGPQIGTGELLGTLRGYDLFLDLNPGWSDENIFLYGKMKGAKVSGTWEENTFGGPIFGGKFVATRVGGVRSGARE